MHIVLIDPTDDSIASYYAERELPSCDSPDDYAIEAAKRLEKGMYLTRRRYTLLPEAPEGQAEGYHAYRIGRDTADIVSLIKYADDPELVERIKRECEHMGFVACEDVPPVYRAVRFAADGQAGEQVLGGYSDGDVICEGSLEECRAAIRRAIGPYFNDPNCPWSPHGDDDVEAYSESDEEGCGGFIIRIVRK